MNDSPQDTQTSIGTLTSILSILGLSSLSLSASTLANETLFWGLIDSPVAVFSRLGSIDIVSSVSVNKSDDSVCVEFKSVSE